ncbi:hypothetical protein Lal_00001498 [Lupinus albus]|nr:hypothetical protein Lal_00001498 [Lupinus albus]
MQSIGDGRIGGGDPLELVRQLRDQAFSDRAARIAAYVGGVGVDANEAALESIADRVVGDANDWDGFRARAERTRYAAVFTGHPTFALNPEAIDHARDALDRFNAALLSAARRAFPDRWLALVPRPLIVSTWVGYDTDGRTDIGWSDTLRFRLRIKRLQLARIHRQASAVSSARELAERVAKALDVLDRQIAACPDGADARQTSRFAQALVAHRDDALVDPETLDTLYRDAIAAAPDRDKLALAVSRAGLASHGLALAHTHFRLNAAQLHNAARQRLNIADSVDAPLHRRAMLAAINAELDKVQPLPVDFGALLAEQATAARTMMTIAQLVKHIDGATPVRFLIAETESGYTLLVALWLARLFGVERHLEISPLFETEEALEHGAHVLDEALRSPHYRSYVKSHGRLALQFGYSDSGRYVGQLAASYLIERLRMKIAGMLARHGLDGVEVVLFDTHGESVGAGGERIPGRRRLSAVRHAGAGARDGRADRRACVPSCGRPGGRSDLQRSRFRRRFLRLDPRDDDGARRRRRLYGDAERVRSRAARPHGFAARGAASGRRCVPRPDSPSERTARDPEQRDPAAARLVREHCARPGRRCRRQPEGFAEMRGRSRRFRRALDLAEAAFAHSDIEVLRAVTSLLDPGTWLDRALHTADGGARDAMLAVAAMLERIDAFAATRAMFRRALADDLALRTVWPNRARMSDREILLHALRLALIQLVWLKATEIPEFSPRPDVTVDDLHRAIVGLDMPSVLPVLVRIFPERTDDTAEYEYAEPARRARRSARSADAASHAYRGRWRSRCDAHRAASGAGAVRLIQPLPKSNKECCHASVDSCDPGVVSRHCRAFEGALRRDRQPGRHDLVATGTDRPAAGETRRRHRGQRPDRRDPARCVPRARGGLQHRCRLQQHRCRRVLGARRDRDQHAGRADRHDRGFRVRADDGDRAAHHRVRALSAQRRVDEDGTLRHVRRLGHSWRDARDTGHGPHRPGDRASRRAWFRHERDLSQSLATIAGSGGGMRRTLCRQGCAAARIRSPDHRGAVFVDLTSCDRRARAQADEIDGNADEYRTGWRGRRQRTGCRARRRRDRRGGARCLRGRAGRMSGIARAEERGADAAYRQRIGGDATGDGIARRRQPDRGAGIRTPCRPAADACQSAGVDRRIARRSIAAFGAPIDVWVFARTQRRPGARRSTGTRRTAPSHGARASVPTGHCSSLSHQRKGVCKLFFLRASMNSTQSSMPAPR